MTSTETKEDANPRLGSSRAEWRDALLIATAIFALKVFLGLQFSGPWFEPDESTYALRGYHLAHGDGLSWRHPSRPAGQEGYAALLAVPWLLAQDDTDRFIRLALVGNALLSLAMVVLGYAIFRRRYGHWPSLAGAAAMTLYAPVFIYGFSLLSESLFFLLFLVAVCCAQRADATKRVMWWILLGAAVALSYTVRVTGAALVAALALVLLLVAARGLVSRAGRPALWGAGAALATLGGVLVLFHVVAQPAPTATAATTTTAVAPVAGKTYALADTERLTILKNMFFTAAGLRHFVQSLLWALDYVLLSALVLPALVLLIYLRNRWRAREANPLVRWPKVETLLVVLSCLGTFGMTAITLGGASAANPTSMYGRYLDLVVMIVVGYAVASGVSQTRTAAAPAAPVLSAGLLFGTTAGLAILAVLTLPQIGMLLSGNLGIYWAAWLGSVFAARLGLPAGRGPEMIALACVLLLAALAVATRLLQPGSKVRFIGLALALLICANTVLVYPAILRFRLGFEDFRQFGRASAIVLRLHFKTFDRLPPLVYIDSPPTSGEVPEAGLATLFAVCNLELYNPSIRFQELTGAVQVPPGTPLFSLRERPFPVLQRKGALRLYRCLNPPAPPPEADRRGTSR